MSIKIKCVMLVDDNPDDNFFHERVLRKSGMVDTVIAMESAVEALSYLKESEATGHVHPDAIFLDINMPGMDGWEFLEEHSKLDDKVKSRVVIVMLTTSQNPDDEERSRKLNSVAGFKSKPLTQAMLDEVINQYF